MPDAPSRPPRRPESVDAWFQARLDEMGDLTVTDADLTNGREWRAVPGEGGEVHEVTGAHFTVRGQWVSRLNVDGTVAFAWLQPGLLANEQDVTVPTPSGPATVRTSGVVGVLTDSRGRILLTAVQEPFANTPKKALVRTPFQTSAAKLAGLVDGRRELDPAMHDLLTEIAGGGSVADAFTGGAVDLFPLPPADANRIATTNVGFVATVVGHELITRLENGGRNRWCTPADVVRLMERGLLNGHTAGAIAFVRNRELLRGGGTVH